MKALKTFLKKSIILLLVIALNHLNAVAMIVDNRYYKPIKSYKEL
ncbi:hypothetical protein [Helicobacter pylori]|nr:hypothetical protein [Helicobacter pylori]